MAFFILKLLAIRGFFFFNSVKNKDVKFYAVRMHSLSFEVWQKKVLVYLQVTLISILKSILSNMTKS